MERAKQALGGAWEPLHGGGHGLLLCLNDDHFGNGAKTPFWDSPWLLGRKPKDIAPLIYGAFTRKNWKVREALDGNAWILKINHNIVASIAHIRQFFTLWMLVHDLHLDTQADDDII